jgi:hypothetical protein
MTVNKINKFTKKFLTYCKKRGLTRIAIGVRTKKIKPSFDWPYSYCDNSVFQYPEDKEYKGCPAIWDVVEHFEISGGCGGHAEHSLDFTKSRDLQNGYFYLDKNKKWKRGEIK